MTQPTTTVLPFATDATFTASDDPDAVGEPCRVSQSGAVAAQGIVAGNPVLVQHLNDQLGAISDQVIHRRDDANGFFGNASAGDVTVTNGSTVTLVEDTYYDHLIVESGGVLICGGFRIFAFSAQIDGTVHADGEDGEDAVSGGPDTPGGFGDGAPEGSVRGGVRGGNGAVFGGNDGNSGGAASLTSIGGTPGAGQDSAANTGGEAGTSSAVDPAHGGFLDLSGYLRAYVIDLSSATGDIVPLIGGTGGGGGASNVSDAGGGGGGGGGILIFACADLTVGATGIIRANGGSGGLGTSPSGDQGDGGHGAAGAVRLLYKRLTNSGTIETLNGDGTDANAVTELRV